MYVVAQGAQPNTLSCSVVFVYGRGRAVPFIYTISHKSISCMDLTMFKFY